MTWWISVLAKVVVVALVAVAAVAVTITVGARTVGAVTSHSAGAMTEVAGAAI